MILLLIAAVCFSLAVFVYWKMTSMDKDPNIPGAVIHVILPAMVLPVIFLLVTLGLLLLYFYFWG